MAQIGMHLRQPKATASCNLLGRLYVNRGDQPLERAALPFVGHWLTGRRRTASHAQLLEYPCTVAGALRADEIWGHSFLPQPDINAGGGFEAKTFQISHTEIDLDFWLVDTHFWQVKRKRD